MKVKVVLHPEQEGGYSVEVPSLPGCYSEGETVEESLANIREAIECYLEAPDDLEVPPTAQVQEVEI